MKRWGIVLADDHVILRHGLRRIIEADPALQVVGEVGDGLTLVRLLNVVCPDLVLLDITMPGLRGIEAISEVRVAHPHVKIIVLTMHRDVQLLNAAMSAGAHGYVLKEDAEAELFAAMAKVRAGGTYVSPKLSEDLLQVWAGACRRDEAALEGAKLTIREREVLKLTAEGKSSKETGALLFISARTVEHHRARIMAKLRLRRVAEVVRYALDEGYL